MCASCFVAFRVLAGMCFVVCFVVLRALRCVPPGGSRAVASIFT